MLKKDLIDFAGKMENIKKKYDTLQVALVKDIIIEGIKKSEFKKMDKDGNGSLSLEEFKTGRPPGRPPGGPGGGGPGRGPGGGGGGRPPGGAPQ